MNWMKLLRIWNFETMNGSAFDRYSSFIQQYIYRKGWTDLREVQAQACEAILDTDSHVVISSGTASGKTEAAFFPILTLLEHNPSKSISVLYVGPLKALINDQFERLNDLLKEQDIPVWPWHGDVSQSKKERAVKTACGILQITPESLEALLMKRPGDAVRMFSDLRFVVIDEIHAFMGTDRGLQLSCLLKRIETAANCRPRRIGLSATLSDYSAVQDYLSAGTDRTAVVTGFTDAARKVGIGVACFKSPEPEQLRETAHENYNRFIYDNCHDKKCLIFTNSRGNAEQVILDMKRIAKERGERDVFYVHHGSLSAAMRSETEHALCDNEGPTVASATLTLELGIDIGDLDCTIQIGAPSSSASFVQRLGRSGRRTGKSMMLFVSEYRGAKKNLPWTLLLSIAVIQLYAKENWVESYRPKKKPYSLLAHQTLSVITENGEMSFKELKQNVLSLPAFTEISAAEYVQLVKYMIQNKYLERIENGGIITGLKGETKTNYYTFYAVFPDEEDYHIISDDGEVGTIGSCPKQGEVLVLSGRAWKVQLVDNEHKKAFVKQTEKAKIPVWGGGIGQVDDKIVQKVKQVLAEDTEYPYLKKDSLAVLSEARNAARTLGLLDKNIFSSGRQQLTVYPWVGDRLLNTIEQLLKVGLRKKLKIKVVSITDFRIEIDTELSAHEFRTRIQDIEIPYDDPSLVIAEKQFLQHDKYDYMVPEELLRVAFLENEMDVKGALLCMKSWR